MAFCRGLLSSMFVVMASCLAVPSLAAVYNVGGSNGWTMGVDYTTWTTGKTFFVGDTLVFNYGGGHTVDEVTPSDYQTCTVGSSITTDNSGATAITLATPGTHYFICGTMGHCGIGMKLAVNVAPVGFGSAGGAGGLVSSVSQPPLSQPPTFGLGLPLAPLGSGVALPPSSLGSMNPSFGGSRNVNSGSLAPTSTDFSRTNSLPDFSAANAGLISMFGTVVVAWGSLVLVFGMF